jgi:hypothetical protein
MAYLILVQHSVCILVVNFDACTASNMLHISMLSGYGYTFCASIKNPVQNNENESLQRAAYIHIYVHTRTHTHTHAEGSYRSSWVKKEKEKQDGTHPF